MSTLSSALLARLDFHYQGKHFQPEVRIDLDAFLHKGGDWSEIHKIIAIENRIDTYSYMFDFMESVPVQYTQAIGLAHDFLQEYTFDFQGFDRAWQAQRVEIILAKIAVQHLNINNINEHPNLKSSLFEAFQAGQVLAHKTTLNLSDNNQWSL